MNDQINAVKDAANKAATSAVASVKSAADRAPKVTVPKVTVPKVTVPDVKAPSFTLPSEVQSYVDAASKSAAQASLTIRTNVSSTVTLLREAVGR